MPLPGRAGLTRGPSPAKPVDKEPEDKEPVDKDISGFAATGGLASLDVRLAPPSPHRPAALTLGSEL